MKKKGLIIVHTGNGKGKTTASLGIAFRAIGHNHRVIMIQFIKSSRGGWHYGEIETAKRLLPNIEIYPMGEGFTWKTRDRDRDIRKVEEAWKFSKKQIIDNKHQIVILDEINYAIKLGYLSIKETIKFLKKKPSELHIVLTGRDAHPELIEIADIVTEMIEIKHPYKEGISAQKGIEF